MPAALRRQALRIYRWAPYPLRRWIVRAVAPRYVVGAVCVVRHGQDVLLLRQRQHAGWTLPGGLLTHGEQPQDAVRREIAEELGLDLQVPRHPAVTVVVPASRRIDLVYVVDIGEDRTRPPVRVDRTEVLEASWRRPGSDVRGPTRRVLDEVARWR